MQQKGSFRCCGVRCKWHRLGRGWWECTVRVKCDLRLPCWCLCLVDWLIDGDGAGNTVEENSSVFSLIRMEWRQVGWSMCLPLLIFPCTIKSRSSFLAPAHPGGPGKRAVKRLWWCGGDWLIELSFYIPLDTKQVISETFFPANQLSQYCRN